MKVLVDTPWHLVIDHNEPDDKPEDNPFKKEIFGELNG